MGLVISHPETPLGGRAMLRAQTEAARKQSPVNHQHSVIGP